MKACERIIMNAFCQFCHSPLNETFVNLGMSPVSNDFIAVERQMEMEPFYPLHVFVCSNCFLVQLTGFNKADTLFSDDYAYFSSYSDSWLEHAKAYAEKMVIEEGLGAQSQVIEIASNDGYLLQYFAQAGVQVLGIEPTANTARVAWEIRGIRSEVAFFGRETAQRLRDQGIQADLMAANNVLAHVPNINDFVSGYKVLLKQDGIANVEFPHLLEMIAHRQFDTIYHEHFSYLSLHTVQRIFAAHDMRVYDVETIPTHGGSLRLYICHADNDRRPNTVRVANMLDREFKVGLMNLDTYRQFSKSVTQTKLSLLEFLIAAHRDGKSVAAYGAPAKGNTLLNYCGIKPDLVPYTVDRSPHKSGKLLPGVRIPICDPKVIFERRPDFLLILPWNLKSEIMGQMSGIREWGGQFVTPIPMVEIHQ